MLDANSLARFEAKIDRSGKCWIWIGSKDGDSYGQISIGGRMVGAHRVSYELHVGPIPAGLCVLHECDNPPCVKPAHLFVGTHAENTADMMTKGRHRTRSPRGEDHGQARLTPNQIRAIRASTKMGTVLAAEYGVTPGMIGHIRHRRRWRHIE